jgi:hypothetical protein
MSATDLAILAPPARNRDPEKPEHLTNKRYVDRRGAWPAVAAATFDDTPLSAPWPVYVDNAVVNDGDRVLLAGQPDPAENGIYIASVSKDGVELARTDDAARADDFSPGRSVFILAGVKYGGQHFSLKAPVPTVGIDAVVFSPMLPITAGSNVSVAWNGGSVEISASSADPFPDHLSNLPDLEHSLNREVLPVPEEAEPDSPGLPVFWELFSDDREDVVLAGLADVMARDSRAELPGDAQESDDDHGVRWELFSEYREEVDFDLDDLRYHFDASNLSGLGHESDLDSGLRFKLFSGGRFEPAVSAMDDLLHSSDQSSLAGAGTESYLDSGLRFVLFSTIREDRDVAGMRDFDYLLDRSHAGQREILPSDADSGLRFELFSDERTVPAFGPLADVLGNGDSAVLPGAAAESDLDSGLRLELYSPDRDNGVVGDLVDFNYHHDNEVIGGATGESDLNSGLFFELFSGERSGVDAGGRTDIRVSGGTWYLPGSTAPSDADAGVRWNLGSGAREAVVLDLPDVAESEDDVFPAYYGPSTLDSGLRFAIPVARERPREAVEELEDVLIP